MRIPMSYGPLTPAGSAWKFVSSIHVTHANANANKACQYVRWLECNVPTGNCFDYLVPLAGKDIFWKVLGMSGADS